MSNASKLRSSSSSGFTLVELSIVLVIVGFLIMGIASGRKLIDSAKVYSVVSELNRYSAAVVIFVTQYDSLPGDYVDGTNGLTGVNSGNGDGLLVSDATYSEQIDAWHHLSVSEILLGPSEQCTTPASCVVSSGVNVPASKISNTVYMPWSATASSHYLVAGYGEGAINNFAAAIPGRIARGVDKKIDGTINPATGTLVGSDPLALKAAVTTPGTFTTDTDYTADQFYVLHLKLAV